MTEQTHKIYCTRCEAELDESRAVWLELNNRTGEYAKSGTIPPEESQGGFPFGSDCARRIVEGK